MAFHEWWYAGYHVNRHFPCRADVLSDGPRTTYAYLPTDGPITRTKNDDDELTMR